MVIHASLTGPSNTSLMTILKQLLLLCDLLTIDYTYSMNCWSNFGYPISTRVFWSVDSGHPSWSFAFASVKCKLRQEIMKYLLHFRSAVWNCKMSCQLLRNENALSYYKKYNESYTVLYKPCTTTFARGAISCVCKHGSYSLNWQLIVET